MPIITIPNEHHHKFGPIQNHRNGFWLKFGEQLFRFIAIFALSLLIKIYLRWKQIEKDKVDIELSYLKAQINPHFLFNTLNSIYSLSIEEKAHKTSSSIVELSKMMRYVLTDSQMEFVSLDKEIDYIKSYIELQKTRLGDTLNLKFTLSGSFSNNQIAPILLIPFIENAFKYGINPEKKSDIILDINCEKDVLNFYVKNDIVTFNSITGEQIGQNNTINRIKLLYSNKYKLNIENSEKYYLVELKLNLK